MIEKELNKIKKKVAKNDPETKEVITISNNITGLHTASNTCAGGGSTTYTFTNMIYNNALSIIPQGTDYNQRVGREVKPQYLEINLILNGKSTAGLDHPYRLIVYQDRGYDGSNLPSMNMILSGYSATNGEYQNWLASFNPDYVSHKGDRKNRFKILVDKKGFVSPRIVTSAAITDTYNNSRNSSINVRVSKKLKSAEIINYSGSAQNTHVAGSIFYILFLGNSSTATDNASAQLRTRLLYTDT